MLAPIRPSPTIPSSIIHLSFRVLTGLRAGLAAAPRAFDVSGNCAQISIRDHVARLFARRLTGDVHLQSLQPERPPYGEAVEAGHRRRRREPTEHAIEARSSSENDA